MLSRFVVDVGQVERFVVVSACGEHQAIAQSRCLGLTGTDIHIIHTYIQTGMTTHYNYLPCLSARQLTPIHSHCHPPHSHYRGTSPSGVWPLEGDPLQLPTSVGYDHPEDWVGHGQYSTQTTTCTNQLNINELSANWWALGLHVCVCTIATVHCLLL